MPIRGISTKTFKMKNGEWELKEGYKAGKFFKGYQTPVDNLKEAFEILKENQKHNCFLIQGAIIEGTDQTKMIRRKRDDHPDGLKPTLTDRNLSLFCLDVDGYSGTLSEFMREMPIEFQRVDYIYQFSSSYGLTAKSLKCHLFFWLKEPVHNLDIREWCKAINKEKDWGNVIDPSVLTSTQPIYTQKRICEGGDDPIKNFIGLVEKEGELDWKPEPINKRQNKIAKSQASYDLASGVEKILTAENYHDELNKLALSLINRKVPAFTVKAMLKGAMNAASNKDKRWKERYDDIDRSVDSAADIVDNPTVEEVLYWIQDEDTMTVKAGYAQRCINLSPMDRTVAVVQICKKIGFGVADVKKTIKLAEEESKVEAQIAAKEAQTAERESRGIYEIEIDPTNSGEVAERAGCILAKSEKLPRVFAMGGHLATVGMGTPVTIRQCHKICEMGADYPEMPIIQPFRKPYYTLGGRIEKDVVFISDKGNDIECPTRVLHMIGEAQNNNFNPLTGIVENPFIDANWNLMKKQGYNSKTGLFTILHRKLQLTQMDPKEAYEYLAYEVFDEFPFNTELDRAVAVSAMMTAVQRPTIAGDTGMPGFGIVSPIQSSGKTTLAQLISYAVFNRPVAASSWSDDDEELGKHILGILQEGHSCVLFDNISQGATIQSGRLANAMSNDIFGGRQLGENKTIQVPSSVIWLFTGNAVKFVGDFATRIYPITINPDMEDPNTRVFKRDDIGQWAMDNRKKIMSAILSIVIGGKGMLEIGGSTRFKLWDKFVRRPLFNASGIDINDAVKNNQKDDPLHLIKANLLSQLSDQFESKQFTTKEMIRAAFGSFEADETELGSAMDDLFGKKSRNAMSVGRYLSSMVDVVLNGMVLNKIEKQVVYWVITKKE